MTTDEQFDADEAAGIKALWKIWHEAEIKHVMREYAVDKFTAADIVENATRTGKYA